MSTRRIVVIGDSHTESIKRAARNRVGADGGVQIGVYMFSRMKNGRPIGDVSIDEFDSILDSLGAGDIVASVIGGNQHQMLGLIQHPEPFDFHDPLSGRETIDSTASCVPRNALRDVFEAGLRGKDGTRLEHVRRRTACRMYHLAPPPPKQDVDHILRRHESAFAEQGLAAKGVSPGQLRVKLWRLQVEVLQALCKEWGVELMLPPQEAVDSDGFLKRNYYANDATHANEAYGELVLRQLIDVMRA